MYFKNELFGLARIYCIGNIETMVFEYFDSCITQESVTLVSVYRSPRVPLQNLILNLDEILSKYTCVITGDFNVDTNSRERFLKYFASKDFCGRIR